MLEKIFKLEENNTSIKTELVAGFTTFVTMAYIIFVNPQMMSICWDGSGSQFCRDLLWLQQ
jgi:AGZA family xanthine/uracil permease-like MFS transporter